MVPRQWAGGYQLPVPPVHPPEELPVLSLVGEEVAEEVGMTMVRVTLMG